MKKPLVSIIIPCYNVEFLIFRLLDSILLQNYSNVEVIAIDDGSTLHKYYNRMWISSRIKNTIFIFMNK